MLKLLISCSVGYKQTVTITSSQTTNNTTSSDGSMKDRNDVCEFTLKDTVKVFWSSDSNQTVRISQLAEYTNIIRILKLSTYNNTRKKEKINKIFTKGL